MKSIKNEIWLGRLGALVASLFVVNLHAQSAASGLPDEQRLEYGRVYGTARGTAQGSQKRATKEEMLKLLESERTKKSPLSLSKSGATILINPPPVEGAMAAGSPVLGYFYAWHNVALDLSAYDHYNPAPAGETPPPTYAEQFGPTRTSRALAIVHLAIFEAVNAIMKSKKDYH